MYQSLRTTARRHSDALALLLYKGTPPPSDHLHAAVRDRSNELPWLQYAYCDTPVHHASEFMGHSICSADHELREVTLRHRR